MKRSWLKLSAIVCFALSLLLAPIVESVYASVRSSVDNGSGDVALRHPVLDFGPDASSVTMAINDRDFKRLIDLGIPQGSQERWAKAFYIVEHEASEALSNRIRGLSQREVIRLIGVPAFKSGSPLCPPEVPDSEQWLYFVGGTPELLRVTFTERICTRAISTRFDRDMLYNWWRAKEFEHFAIGKTIAQVTAFEGQPFERYKQAQYPLYLRKLAEKLNFGDAFAANVEKADDIFDYRFGDSTHLVNESLGRDPNRCLLFKDGICFYAGDGPFNTVRCGPGPDTPLGAPFKRPHSLHSRSVKPISFRTQ